MKRTKTSKVAKLKSLMEQRDALERQIQRLDKDTTAIMAICEKVRELAREHGIPVHEIAYALAPELNPEEEVAAAATPTRTREQKIYVNPHSGETVKTKGGNHKILKQWKTEYGPSVVESWRTQ